MRLHARVWFLALLTGVLVSLVASAGAQAAAEVPMVEKLVAINCTVQTCGQEEVEPGFFEPKAKIEPAEAEAEGFTQAGGRVPYGVTDFKVLTIPGGKYSTGTVVPTSLVTHIRTDVASGLATNPFAVERCTLAEFGDETIPGTGFFTEPTGKCDESEIGENDVIVYAGNPGEGGAGDLPLSGEVYDLIPGKEERMANGAKLASDYGVALELPTFLTKALLTKGFAEHPLPEAEFPGKTKAEKEAEKEATEEALEKKQWYAHTLIKGNVEWGKEARGTNKGDYHDYFEIEVSTALPLIRSRLVFEGTAGKGDFITNATSCPGDNTTKLQITDKSGTTVPKEFTTPIGLKGCESLVFKPTFALSSETTGSDQPNGITAEASDTNEAEGNNPEKAAPSQVKTASITLPAGMTLNPSAAAGLEDCTPAEARTESEEFGVACPSSSQVGTVSLNVPTLPDGSLTGNVYLGGPESGPITGPPYTVYVVANSVQYGISVRLKAEVIPNETTGQLTTVFPNPPEQPFTNLAMHFNRGMLTSIANPLICGTPEGSATFTPVASGTPTATDPFGVSVTGCAASLPFALSQSTESDTATGGAHTAYTFNLARAEGQQYLEKIKTTLPAGLVGEIPAITLCGEPGASKGECPTASKIGTATVTAGSGNFPYSFSGPVYMTGPYNGAPFGLSINVPAVAGPFNLGPVVTRSTININQTTARVTAETTLPTIVKGIPLRMRSLSVNVNKQGFLLNPTNCSAEATETSLTSTFGAVQSGLSSPFQAEGCGSLAFKPAFAASTSGKHSKTNGASLVTTITQAAGQANIKSVLVTLPKALPSRLTTLQKACLAKTFEENPLSCAKVSPGSEVGTATALTPTLPVVMKGPAFLVSHGGEEFPALELVLEGDGVRIIVEGKTDIKKGITTTDFETAPDVPVSSITVNLPTGPHSALTTEQINTNLCTAKLVMPTVITGQNGKQVKQNTVIAPTGCGVQIVGHKVVGNTLYLTVRTYTAGRVSGSGRGLSTAYRTLGSASKATTLKIPLSRAGRSKGRPFSVKVRVGFVPKAKGAHSSATVTVKFRR
ncbi:MAG: hypothetical protein ABR992_12125 [Solirubrobacteraceae bacterium]